MSKPFPARYRTTIWPDYNASLRQRGSLLVWLGREMKWSAPKLGRRGRPQTFSDAAIQFCLSIKVLFGLALRQAIGMVDGFLRLAGLDWSVPDYSTLCRRQKTVSIQIPFRRAGGNRRCCTTLAEAKFSPFPSGSGDAHDLSRAKGRDRACRLNLRGKGKARP